MKSHREELPEYSGGGRNLTEKELTDESILRGVDVDESGIVQLWIQPTHPHCPCCIDDLISLRELIGGQSGVLACHIEVVGIPHSDRWTAAVNE